jgi:hypothetical protein
MKLFVHIGILSIVLSASLFGWGGVAHRFINKNATVHLPSSMQVFINQSQFFSDRSTDPDTRRDYSDTSFFAEQNIHFLDIDNYPNFNVWLPRSLDSLIAIYGWRTVKDNGTIPWVIAFYVDSLSAQLKRGDWNTSYQTASDLGHYVADSHVPLHATRNYDGQYSSQKGIHSRYETQMISRYQAQLTVTKDSVRYINNVLEYAMQFILHSVSLLDSVLLADKYAAPPDGYNGITGAPSLPADYYVKLWEKAGGFTKKQVQNATISLANLWYTAWVNAGLLSMPTGIQRITTSKPSSFTLHQNFPNPFNPATTIEFDIADRRYVKLEIFSVDGKRVAVLADAQMDAGKYAADWDAKHVPSGLYFYRLTAGEFGATKKLVIVK